MRALGPGVHRRRMILCKVAKGVAFPATTNMSNLQGQAPEGYHSIHAMATDDTPFTMDELVVFEEEAILPYALVEYEFRKLIE